MELQITKYGTVRPSSSEGSLKEYPILKFIKKLSRRIGKFKYIVNTENIGDFYLWECASVKPCGDNCYLICIGNENYTLNISEASPSDKMILKAALNDFVERSSKVNDEKRLVKMFENNRVDYEEVDLSDIERYLKHIKHFRNIRRIYEAIVIASAMTVTIPHCTLWVGIVGRVFAESIGAGFASIGASIVIYVLLCLLISIPLLFEEVNPLRAFKINRIANFKIKTVKQNRAIKMQLQKGNSLDTSETASVKNTYTQTKDDFSNNVYVNFVLSCVAASIKNINSLDREAQLKKLAKLKELLTTYHKAMKDLDRGSILKRRSRNSLERTLTADILRELRDLDAGLAKSAIPAGKEEQMKANNGISIGTMENIIAYYMDALSQTHEKSAENAYNSKVYSLESR